MFSYVFMKILEARPKAYDRGLYFASRGRLARVKRRIVEEQVRAGDRLLEIGVGTGTLAVMAAGKGAQVVGFDSSPGMLDVARVKVEEAGYVESIELRPMGVADMDTLDGDAFDMVVSTLVFSELTDDEQSWALEHSRRVLVDGGRLVIADEVRPGTAGMRLLHGLARAPMAALTFVMSGGASTSAVRDLEARVRSAGFVIDAVDRWSMDAFMLLSAHRG